MKFNELFSKLNALGLEQKETQILASLLLSGTRSVTQIAENSDLKRPHAYNLLRSLHENGLVTSIIKNKTLHYSPPKAQDLLDYLARKKERLLKAEENIEALLPELAQLTQLTTRKPQIRFYWGVDGLLSIYQDTLKAHEKVIYAFCDFQTVFPEERDPTLNRWMWSYASDRAKAGIIYKGIVNKSKISDEAFRRSQTQLRELKMVEGRNFPMELNIYDDKVAFMSSAINFMGIVIEDKDVAKMLRTIHDLLWKSLPKYT